MRDVETLAALVIAIGVSVFASAVAGAALALAFSIRFVLTAVAAFRRGESLARDAYLSWERGYWACACVVALALGMAFVRPLQLFSVWLLGVGLLAISVLGLSARFTWSRSSRVTPDTSAFDYWMLTGAFGVFGVLIIAGATYRFGRPVDALCRPWNC